MLSNYLDKCDFAVVGGGVNGLCSAWWIAKEGYDVVVLERGIIGWEASGRNGGEISHRGVSPSDGLGRASHELWPDMDSLLGYPTEFSSGLINVAMDGCEMELLKTRKKELESVDSPVEFIDAKSIRELVPVVSPEVVGGLYWPTGGHANPQRTVQAYAWALTDLGGRIYQNTTVTGFEMQGTRVVSVKTDRGRVMTDFVICAAGPQTGIMAELVGAFVPVSPGRAEIVVTAPLEPMWKGFMSGNGLYGRQTLRGNLAYGGGPHEWIDVEMGEPRKPNTPLVRNISRRLAELYPGAMEVPVIRSWGGVIEQTPDYQPIVDILPEPSNFLVLSASGAGFGRSPGTGKATAELAIHGESTIDIQGLRLGRFSDLRIDWREDCRWTAGNYNT